MRQALTFNSRGARLLRAVTQKCRENGAIDITRCQKKTLCPDDIIRPCKRPAFHEGFCDGEKS